jgi:polygalacturonase
MVLLSRVAALALSLGGLASATNVQLRGSWLEISVGSSIFSVVDYGAKGDGKHDDTKAVHAAFAAAAKASGGTVLFPAGKTYLTTAFQFVRSNTVMHVPLGARVVFSNDQKLYDGEHDLIMADGLSNIGITGGGIIDGQGPNWWACRATGCFRPKTFNIKHCDHVLLMDVTFKDSPNHVLEMGSDYTEMSHVAVLNPPSTTDKVPVNGTYGPSHNTDGVDVHGTPFYIHNCHFDTGDDNVAVHASHLLVENSYFGHGHGASIGSCGSGTALENITFRNIVFNQTEAGAKIKTDAGAKKAYVRNVVWENMIHYNVKESISIDMFYDHGKNKTTDFKISNITIRNLTMHGTTTEEGKQVTPGYFHCQETSPCHDIRLQDISTIDSKVPFDCYNAYGSWDHTSPTPCLKKDEPWQSAFI